MSALEGEWLIGNAGQWPKGVMAVRVGPADRAGHMLTRAEPMPARPADFPVHFIAPTGTVSAPGWRISRKPSKTRPADGAHEGADQATEEVITGLWFLGGSGLFDTVKDIAVTDSGGLLMTGATRSVDFPVSPGVFQPFLSGNADAFVVKADPVTGVPEFITFFGGSGADFGEGIAPMPDGSVAVAGFTDSPDLPGLRPARPARGTDAFAAVFSPNGSDATAWLWGGAETDRGTDVVALPDGHLAVVGESRSWDLHAGGSDRQLCTSGSSP